MELRESVVRYNLNTSLLTAFWVGLLSLGTFAFDSQITLTYAALTIFLIGIFLSRPRFVASHEVAKIRVSILLVPLMLTLQFVAGILSNYSFSEKIPNIIFLLASLAIVSSVHVATIIRSFYIAGILLIFLGWLVELLVLNSWHLESGFSINPLGWRWMGLQSHPNLAGFVMAVIFGLAVLEYRNKTVAALALLTLLFTEHRSGILGALVILAYFTWQKFKQWSQSKKIGALTLWLIFIAVSPSLIVGRSGDTDITTGRREIWLYCIQTFQQSPVYGNGPNTLAFKLGLDNMSSINPFHCHNQLLDDLVNFGFIGGTLSTVLLLVCAAYALRETNYLLIPVVATCAVSWLTESPFRIFGGSSNMFLVLLILIVFLKASVPSQAPSPGGALLDLRREVITK